MADDQNGRDKQEESGADQENEPRDLLIAHVRAHLLGGESFDLLPIKHPEDVKSEVSALVESWASSGFLLRGRNMYPWHQVKYLEVLQVDSLPSREAHQRLEELYAADRARLQESFWKTRKKRGAGQKNGEGNGKEEKK